MGNSDPTAPDIAGPKPHELLLKELDERNQNARAVMQGYLAWYTFFVTANITIIGLALINADKISSVRPYLAGLFIIINLLAIVGTLIIVIANGHQNERVKEVIAELNSRALKPSAETVTRLKMESPYPYRLIKILLWMVFISLVGIIFFWVVFIMQGAPRAAG